MNVLEKLLVSRAGRIMFLALTVLAVMLALNAVRGLLGETGPILKELGNVTRLALLSYLFAYLFNPLVQWLVARQFLQARGIKPFARAIAVTIVYLIVILFLIVASLVIGSLIRQLIVFAQQLPTLVTSLQNILNGWVANLQQVPELKDTLQNTTKTIQDGLSSLVQKLLEFLQGSGLSILTRAVGVVGNVFEYFLVFVLGGYMLFTFPAIGKTLLEVFPVRFQATMLELSKDVSTAVGGYIRGQIIIALSIGIMIGLGLTIVGLPLGLAIGFIAGVFNIVPYLGVVIAVTPALLLALPGGLIKILLVGVVFTIVNQLESHVFAPQILSKSTDLSPISIILAILSGLALGGVVGALLAVPLTALAKLLIRKYWIGSRFHGGEKIISDTMLEPVGIEEDKELV
jgi:predicted PurR-regulated permease PerM